jgi:UTP:GlnB (protein PII) uridylyltransferase
VRSRARSTGSKTVRLTVAAQDRRGLLGDTTGVFAHHGLCITDASAATWTKQHLALHALTVDNAVQIDATEWDQLGDNLRTICAAGHQERPDFVPLGHATVTVYGNQRQRTLIRILAPDQIGLLSTICYWFADHDLSVESLQAATDGETAHDIFLIKGSCRAQDLARHLSRQ